MHSLRPLWHEKGSEANAGYFSAPRKAGKSGTRVGRAEYLGKKM